MYERSRVNVKVEPRSTFTFTGGVLTENGTLHIMRGSYLTIYQNVLETVKITERIEDFQGRNFYVIEYRVIS